MTEQDTMEAAYESQKDKYLTFTLGHEAFGIEIQYILEIIGIQPITEVPEMPDYIKGIINLRGSIIPVMDARMRFRKPYVEYNDRTCIIVIRMDNIPIGLIVDSVSEVLVIPSGEVVPPPDIRGKDRFVKGIGKVNSEVKLILDCRRLLHDSDADQLSVLI